MLSSKKNEYSFHQGEHIKILGHEMSPKANPVCSAVTQSFNSLNSRLLRHAVDLGKSVLIVNVGPTRADSLLGVEKVKVPAGLVLRNAVQTVM